MTMPQRGGDRGLKFMTVTNAKATLTALVAEVETTGEPVAITKNGIPVVILRKVRQEEFLLLEEPPIKKFEKGGKPSGTRKRDL